jgi:hypothetical protein
MQNPCNIEKIASRPGPFTSRSPLLVLLWLFPTVGLFVSSFRTADQIANSGWWASLFTQEQNEVFRPIRIDGAEERWMANSSSPATSSRDRRVTISLGHQPRANEAYEPARWPTWAMASA